MSSGKQTTIMSTPEAEYKAASGVGREAMWLRQFLRK